MPHFSNPGERQAWLGEHALDLDEVAHETELAVTLVHMAADLVLAGLVDDEIYEYLQAHVLSLDGDRSPLGGAPQALHEIRRLVGTTTEESSQ